MVFRLSRYPYCVLWPNEMVSSHTTTVHRQLFTDDIVLTVLREHNHSPLSRTFWPVGPHRALLIFENAFKHTGGHSNKLLCLRVNAALSPSAGTASATDASKKKDARGDKQNKKASRGRNKKRPKDDRPPQGEVLCPHVSDGNACRFGTRLVFV